MCNQSKRWARRHGQVTSWSGSLKTREVQPASAFCLSAKLCVCASVTIYESYLLSSNIESSSMSKAEAKHKGKSSSRYRLCVPPCPRYISSGDTHGLCVVWLGAKHASTARFISGFHCVRFTPRRLFEEGAFPGVPRGAGSTVAEAERRLGSWESQMDQVEGMKTVEPLSSSFHQIQRPLSGTGSMSRGSSPLDAPPVFLRGHGGRRWAFVKQLHKHVVNEYHYEQHGGSLSLHQHSPDLALSLGSEARAAVIFLWGDWYCFFCFFIEWLAYCRGKGNRTR